MDTETAPKRLTDLTITGSAGVERGANVSQVGASGWMVLKADGSPIDSQEGAPMATDAAGSSGTDAAETVTVSKADYDALVAKAAKGENPFAGDKDKAKDDEEDGKDEVAKAFAGLPEAVRKAFEDRISAAESVAKAAQAAAETERNTRLDAEYVTKAAEFGKLPTTAEAFGPVLRSVDERLSPEHAAEVRRMLKAACEAVEFAGITKSFGAPGASESSAAGRIEKAAAVLVAGNPAMSHAAAIDTVLTTQPDLAAAYAAERG